MQIGEPAGIEGGGRQAAGQAGGCGYLSGVTPSPSWLESWGERQGSLTGGLAFLHRVTAALAARQQLLPSSTCLASAPLPVPITYSAVYFTVTTPLKNK